MLLIDLEEGRIVEDEEVKARLADAAPYGDWLRDTQFKLEDLPPGATREADRARRLCAISSRPSAIPRRT